MKKLFMIVSLFCAAVLMSAGCAVAPKELNSWVAYSKHAETKSRVFVQDPSGKSIDYNEASEKIKAMLVQDKRVQVKVFLFIRVNKPLDYFGDMELFIAGMTSENSGGAQLKTDAILVKDPNVPAGKVIKIGELFGKTLGAEVDQIKCEVSIVEDDGIGLDEKELVQKTLDDLKAYADSGVPGVGATVVKYTPILPIFFDLVNWIFADDRVQPAPMTLQASQSFVPSIEDLTWNGNGFAVAYVVQVGGYRFASQSIGSDVDVQKYLRTIAQ